MTRTKVLIADGDHKIRELIRDNLAEEQFEVWEAATAWECVRLGCIEGPDVMVLDLDLHDHDGWEVLSMMKVAGTLSNCGVIVTSADLPSPAALRRFPAADFIRKPFDIRDLMRRVDRALAVRSGPAVFTRRSRGDLPRTGTESLGT